MIMPPLFVWGSFAQTCTCFFLFREALHKCAWLHFLFGEALHKRARISFYSGKPCTNVHGSTFCLGKLCTNVHVFLFIQGSLAQMCIAPLFVWGSHVQSSRLHFLFGEAMYKVRGSTFCLAEVWELSHSFCPSDYTTRRVDRFIEKR